MFNKAKNWLIGSAAFATAVMAEESAPDWATQLSAGEFTSIIGEVAPIALTVVFAVAGVRVAIKLINRGAGK